MPNLLTITFSPCIDKSVKIPILLPEKKMHCSFPVYEPGGGGINIARAIRKLGFITTAIYPAGGSSGLEFGKMLHQEGVPVIVVETNNEIRENLHVVDQASNLQYRFVMPGVSLLQQEIEGCMAAIKNSPDSAFIIISGSMPPGVPADIFQQIGKIARDKNAKLIIDTSSEALLHTKDCGVFLLKPNISELSILAGRKEIHLDEIETVAREVMAKGYCEILVISIGASGAIMVTGDKIFRAIPPVIKPKGTVGAGDCLVAGLVIAFSQGKSMEDTIRYGVSCGTAACLNEGTALCRPEDVYRIFRLTRVFNS